MSEESWGRGEVGNVGRDEGAMARGKGESEILDPRAGEGGGRRENELLRLDLL